LTLIEIITRILSLPCVFQVFSLFQNENKFSVFLLHLKIARVVFGLSVKAWKNMNGDSLREVG
jgi:hypothetical protein